MADITVSLPDDLQAFVDERVATGPDATAGDYLARLAAADRERVAKERLEALLIEGLESGPGVELTSNNLDALEGEMQQVIDRVRQERMATATAE